MYYQTVIDKLIEICFPSKVVTRHTGDKPWITDLQKRQRAHMRGDMVEARSLRNQVNRATAKPKFEFCHKAHLHALKQCMNREKKIGGKI